MHLRVKVLVATIHDPAPEHRHAITLVRPGAVAWRNEALVGFETENTSDSQGACRQRQLLPVGAFDCRHILHIYVLGYAVQTNARWGEVSTSIRGCQEGRVTLVRCDLKLPVEA